MYSFQMFQWENKLAYLCKVSDKQNKLAQILNLFTKMAKKNPCLSADENSSESSGMSRFVTKHVGT